MNWQIDLFLYCDTWTDDYINNLNNIPLLYICIIYKNILQNKSYFITCTINQEPRWGQVCKTCFCNRMQLSTFQIEGTAQNWLWWSCIETVLKGFKYLSCTDTLILVQFDSDVCTYVANCSLESNINSTTSLIQKVVF